MNTQIIGERIKEIRISNKLNQLEFGKKLGVSQDTVSLWENGKSVPAVYHILLIVDNYKIYGEKITADYLLGLEQI